MLRILLSLSAQMGRSLYKFPSILFVISLFVFFSFSLPITFATTIKPPTIEEVLVDFDTQTIQIMGDNLRANNKKPKVVLGEFGALTVTTSTNTLVVCNFPVGGLPDGEYLLLVITVSGVLADEYDLTVSSASGSGKQGPPGPPGPAGPAGPQGLPGPVGATGPQGPQGEQGPQGSVGPIGETGPPGEDGEDGLPTLLRKSDEPVGDNCASGGTKIETGLDADNNQTLDDPEVTNTFYVCKGEAGPEGPQGPEGPIGATGPVGPQGPPGVQGETGTQGLQGEVGPQGPQGPAGIDGLAGLDGISCWDLNSNNTCDLPDEDVNADNICTPLDCQGPQGEQGEVGPEGAQGPQGPAGNDGAQGPAGPTGPQGLQGDVGPQGPLGPAGNDGAQGPAGPEGPQGLQGEVGSAGLNGFSCWDLDTNGQCDLFTEDIDQDNQCTVLDCQGPQGEQGEIGPEGSQGPQGPAGNDGAQGPAGPAGADGPAGPQGPAGATGPQGPPGPQGEPGPAGPEGPQGPPGPNQLSSNSDPCNAANVGALRFNNDSGTFEGCDGSEWRAFAYAEPEVETLASCLDIHNQNPSAGNGLYNIDPDGASGSPAFQVYCDMTTDGGGWTLVYKAPNANVNNPNPQYDVNNSILLTNAAETLIGYVNSSNAIGSPRAKFNIPSNWRTAHPLSYANQDQTVTVSIDGGSPQSSITLRYGNQAFNQVCTDPWSGGSRGRICLQNTSGPFYSDFNIGSQDFCNISTQPSTAIPCNDSTRLFAIFIR